MATSKTVVKETTANSGGGEGNSVQKVIQDIKEITGNDNEDEIYAMLKECSMDPNETTQKLLLQDTFHEVKRKRDRKKEVLINKESDSKWKQNPQGRGNRSGRANYSSRHASHDTGGSRNSAPGKEKATNQVFEKSIAVSPLPSQEQKDKEITPVASSVNALENGPSGIVPGSTSATHTANSGGSRDAQTASSSTSDVKSRSASPLPALDKTEKKLSIGKPVSSSSNDSISSAVCFSSSDPVLVPSNDSRHPNNVGAIKREVGSQRSPDLVAPAERKTVGVSEVGGSIVQEKGPSKSHGVSKNQVIDSSQHSVSVSRPTSNYGGRTQLATGPQKAAGPSKEWKPKPTNTNISQGGVAVVTEVPAPSIKANAQSQPALGATISEEATSKVQIKFGDLHIKDRQHVIIPNHIHVPESERSGLSFGSFDANFTVSTTNVGSPESDRSSTAFSDTSPDVEEAGEEQSSSKENAFTTVEHGDYTDRSQSPANASLEVSSGEAEVSSGLDPEFNDAKQDVVLPHGNEQISVVHTSPNYNFGFAPPVLGTQVTPSDNSEFQARDVSRLPNLLVQHPFDPANYYAQFYRNTESDGRISPFPAPGVGAKYNGNVAVLSAPASQAPQEGGNSLVLTTVGTPLVNQTTGVMQSTLALTQQPLPIFRPPAGMHISHYPPNFIPYGPYISPFYLPAHPAIHQFLSSGAFPQQPQPTGNLYPPPPAAGVKYPISQFKPAGNSPHIGMAGGYGPYSSSPSPGNSSTSEDLGVSQFTGQQSEGSAVWVAGPGRDMSSLPANSFYNLSPHAQGQHVAFAPAQSGHGTFSGVYHPAQAISAASVHPMLQQSQTMAGAVDMVGPTANVYQQPQHSQVNWPANY